MTTERKDIVGTLLDAAFDLIARYTGTVLVGTAVVMSIVLAEIEMWIERSKSPRQRLQEIIDNGSDEERRAAREQLAALDEAQRGIERLRDEMEEAQAGKGLAMSERKNYGGWSLQELLEPLDPSVMDHARMANSGNVNRLIAQVEQHQSAVRSAAAQLMRTFDELNGWLETTGYMKADIGAFGTKQAPGAHATYR
jgi:hypothetical protein